MEIYLIIDFQSEFDIFNNIYSKNIKYLVCTNHISMRGKHEENIFNIDFNSAVYGCNLNGKRTMGNYSTD